MNPSSKTVLVASAACAAVVLGCVPTDSLQNGNFDDWCGDHLCLWETNAGHIEKVTTWHRQDFGADFVEDPTVISQRVENGDTKCFLFTITANVDDSALLFFEIDYLDDDWQHPEFSVPIRANDWNRIKLDVAVPAWCNTFRVIFRKTGMGSAVVAAVSDHRYEECPISIPDGDRPLGMSCTDDSQCKAGRCERFSEADADIEFYTCGECSDDEDCTETSVCGLETVSNEYFMYRGCGEAGRHVLGERCILDGECKSGICCGGQCSTCCESADCTGGASCTEQDVMKPHQCGPKAGVAAQGEACLSDADCANGACEAASADAVLRICTSDGRRCTADIDCPGTSPSNTIWTLADELLGTEDKCVFIGALDGECR